MQIKPSSIVVHLAGGLGNQLFQFAYGLSESLSYGCDLHLDTTTGFYRDHRYKRSFALDVFRLRPDIRLLRPSIVSRFGTRLAVKFSQLGWNTGVQFEPSEANRRKGSVRLIGYWQSEKFFTRHSQELRECLAFRSPLPAKYSKWMSITNRRSTAAVHVRQDNYQRAMPPSYYRKAIDHLLTVTDRPALLFFSDAPDWCSRHLLPRYGGTIVTSSVDNSLHEFQLMCMCNHFVISNSSYSWWAAWLGAGRASITICPSARFWHNPGSPCCEWIQFAS